MKNAPCAFVHPLLLRPGRSVYPEPAADSTLGQQPAAPVTAFLCAKTMDVVVSCRATLEPPSPLRDLPRPGGQSPTINSDVDGIGTKAIRGRRAGSPDPASRVGHEALQARGCGRLGTARGPGGAILTPLGKCGNITRIAASVGFPRARRSRPRGLQLCAHRRGMRFSRSVVVTRGSIRVDSFRTLRP
jgi:hypothetical protein